jgi:hypothetical protein
MAFTTMRGAGTGVGLSFFFVGTSNEVVASRAPIAMLDEEGRRGARRCSRNRTGHFAKLILCARGNSRHAISGGNRSSGTPHGPGPRR